MPDFPDCLQYVVQDRVATLTLNRPESFNSLNNELSFAVIDAFKAARRDPDVRVVVLTGAGEKAFCSGQDLKDRAGGGGGSLGESVRTRYNPMVRSIVDCEKPIICRLNGLAAGAGAGFALACDYTLAADTAYLLFAFANIGLVPDTGSSFTLSNLVGRRKAFELLSLGEKVSAEQALEMGLINRVVPASDLDTATAEIAQRYAERPPISMRIIKQMVNQAAAGATFEEMLTTEMHGQEIAGRSNDFMEGVAAFLQKRKPVFQGK